MDLWVGEQCEKGLWMDGTRLKRVESFEYLGITFDKKGINVKKQVSRMCSNARKTHFILKRIGFNGQGFSINTNLRLYRSLVRSRMEYGLAIMNVNKGNLKCLETA